MADKVEEELRRISVEMRILEQTAENLNTRINMVNTMITDLTYANMTLEGLDKQKENTELLVPIGGGSYIKAKLETPDKVTVGIGAGVSVEKTLQDAKDIINKRLEEMEKNRATLQHQFSQIVERINENREKFEELAAEFRKGNPPKNV